MQVDISALDGTSPQADTGCTHARTHARARAHITNTLDTNSRTRKRELVASTETLNKRVRCLYLDPATGILNPTSRRHRLHPHSHELTRGSSWPLRPLSLFFYTAGTNSRTRKRDFVAFTPPTPSNSSSGLAGREGAGKGGGKGECREGYLGGMRVISHTEKEDADCRLLVSPQYVAAMV